VQYLHACHFYNILSNIW